MLSTDIHINESGVFLPSWYQGVNLFETSPCKEQRFKGALPRFHKHNTPGQRSMSGKWGKTVNLLFLVRLDKKGPTAWWLLNKMFCVMSNEAKMSRKHSKRYILEIIFILKTRESRGKKPKIITLKPFNWELTSELHTKNPWLSNIFAIFLHNLFKNKKETEHWRVDSFTDLRLWPATFKRAALHILKSQRVENQARQLSSWMRLCSSCGN